MSKVLKVVAVVAGVVAVVASGGAALGVFGPGATAATATTAAVAASAGYTAAMTVGAIASLVSMAASFGSQLLAKPPPARGNVNQLLVETNAVQPYAMGRTYFGGVLRHVASYGPTIDKVPNPYLSRVVVYSGAGPIDAIEALQVDYGAIGSYYSGFLYTSSQLGLCPETTALSSYWSGLPGWSSSHKLSGQAAAMWNFKFDKNGKVFASGLPQTGALMRGVKVYDPRLDSTYPGGSGSQRITDESTWVYSDNPALHALAYAYGRHQNGKKVLGVGLPVEALDLPAFVAWANVCDANDWSISGVLFEPDDRWKNLKDIMAAGGAEPVFSGAKLSVKYHAPRVALDTITADDLTDGEVSITAMRSYRERINTIVPKWRSEAHNWEYVSGADVAVSTYVTEDGEEKKEERQFNFVANGNQAAQLATYDLLERRELGVIEIACGPRLLAYRPGETLYLDLPDEGLDGVEAVILKRTVDPGTMTVNLTLIGETSSKHAFALGKTATPPPTPSLTMTQQDRDTVAGEIQLPVNNATINLYQRTATNTAPSVTTSGYATYTFETGAITGQPSGWTIGVPSSGGGYLWTIRAVASSQATIDLVYNTEWSAPTLVARDGTDGVVGSDGTPALSISVTKKAVALPSYADGGVTDFSAAEGLLKVYYGATDVTASATLSATASGCTGTINTATDTPVSGQPKGYYRVTAMSADTATLTLSATYSGITLTEVFSLGKAKGGYEIVAALPSTNLFEGRVVYLTTDDKLYRYTGSAWTSAVPTTDLSGQITTSQITDAAITTAKFASSIEPVTTVSAVPGVKSTNTIFNTTDGKLYRWNGSSYVATVPTSDLSGTVSDAQIAGLAASKVTGTLSDSQLAAISAAKITGQITGTQITDGAISVAKFASSIEPVTTVSSVPGTKSTNTIFNTTDGKLYRWNGSSYVATVPTTDLSGTLTDAQLTAISAAKITGTLSDSQLSAISAAKVTGQIVGTQITDGAITTAKLAAGSVTASTIAADTITAANIAANAITASELAAGAVTAGKIAAGSIVAADIAAGTITGDRLAANTITASNIAASTITGSQIAADTITAGNIAAGAISASELAADAVTTDKLLVSGRGAALNPDPACQDQTAWTGWSFQSAATVATVTDGKVGNTVLRAYGGTRSISSKKIPCDPGKTYRLSAWVRAVNCNGLLYLRTIDYDATEAVSGGIERYFSGLEAVTPPNNTWTRYETQFTVAAGRTHFTPHILLAWGASTGYMEAQDIRIEEVLPATLIQNGAITTDKIAANAVTAGKIAAASITSAEIAADTITAANIAAGAITASELAAGAVTAGKIAAGSIVAADIAAGTITGDRLAANTITASQIAADTITAGQIAAGAITASELAAGSVVAGKIAANAVTATEIAADAVTTNKIAAGSVTAAKMSVTQLDAITATIGTLRTATTGARTEISDNVIKVYDSSNVLRVKIGNLSL